MGKEETEKVDMEHWLHERIGPAYDALKADPGRAVTADQVRTRLADIAQAIELARRVYKENDQRAALKREINRVTGSTLVEEKSYGA